MFNSVKRFIETYIQLIEDEQWIELYKLAFEKTDVGNLTESLLSSGIDPLKKLTKIPVYYLAQTTITSFNVPEHITIISKGAFWVCEDLTSVKLNDNIFSIDDDAFSECHKLEHINLPENLQYLGEDSFAETAIKHLVIPKFVVSIPTHCFEECEQLETIKLGENVEKLCSGCFGGCRSLRYIQLNEGLKTIDDYVFRACGNLKEIYIPDSVTKIHDTAFYDCSPKIICSENSTAHKFASNLGYNYKLI